MDHLKETYPTLVEEVTPSPLQLGEIQKVLSNLLKEKISIRNLPTIFEILAEYGQMTKDMDLITEYVRQGLSRQITKQFAQEGSAMQVITISGGIEKQIADNIQQTEHGNYLAMDPGVSQQILESISRETERAAGNGQPAILLCSPAVRMHLRQLVERYLPQVPVLSYNELEPSQEVQSIGIVQL